MTKGRCLGLLGGLGVAATVHYYRSLAQAHEQRGASMDMVMAHARVSQVFEYLRAGDRAGLTDYLLTFLNRLEAAGAECAVIPAVAPHVCIHELISRTRLQLFNIFDPLRDELHVRSIRRVAVFGTRFVMDSQLYGMVPEVEVIPARASETDEIDRHYSELALRGEGSDEQYRCLTRIADTLCKRDQVDAILFAGTDLTLLFNESNTLFPYVDCAAVHLRAIMDGLLGGSPGNPADALAINGTKHARQE